MPLFRQLEFGFRSIGILPASRTDSSGGEPLEQPSVWPGESPGKMAAGPTAETAALLRTVRELLCANGAHRIAHEICIEWNARLKTCAGRADYGRKLIILNPQLVQHPSEIDRTLRHELAHLLAQFRAGRRRISPHGVEWREACRGLGIADERRCHNLPFAAQTYPARFVYRCPHCREEFQRVRRVRRAVACLACCRAYNRGKFDPRFRLRLVSSR